jgi:general secretion pathway protein I
MRTPKRAFTLLEVMVAMGILAMGMTMLLSSQAGLFASAKRVQDETYAASLMRCKMSEVEQDLLVDGFPLIEQSDSGPCCEDFEGDFTCEWTIQTVQLPEPAPFTESEEFGEDGEESSLPATDPSATPFGSPMGDAAALLPMSGDALSGVDGMGDLAGTLGESAAGGGMIGMALSLVYPTLKPMLEASIRKVKVAVVWREGEKERRFEVIQYVANPLEGGLNPNADEGLEELAEQLNGGLMGGLTASPTEDTADADSAAATTGEPEK